MPEKINFHLCETKFSSAWNIRFLNLLFIFVVYCKFDKALLLVQLW